MKKLVKTGVVGLDELLGGGLPEGSVVVLSGPPGVGKSTIAMQYINQGAIEGETGIFLSIENNASDVIEYASSFGWDFLKQQEEKKLLILDRTIFTDAEMQLSRDFGALKDILDDMRPKRFVVDSVTLFDFLFRDDISRKMNMMKFVELMKKHSCTVIMTLKQPEDFPTLIYTDWHFLADGLIVMFWNRNRAENERCIWTVKLRGHAIDTNIRPLKITDKGLVIYTNDIPSIPQR